LEDFVVALVLGFAGVVIEVVEVEPAGEFAFAEGAEPEVEVEEVAQAQEGERETHAVHFVKVDDGVGSHGIQYLVYLDEALLLLHSQVLHIVHASEERLEERRAGDGEADAGVGMGIAAHERCHEGDIAEGGEAYDENVFQGER
jgi:hypothetical protein